MKRTYTIEKYREIVERVRERMPNVAITTDCIIGFCGETEDEYEETVLAFEQIRFDNAFLFAYSPRHSTDAWNWPDDVATETKQRRLSDLIDRQREISRDINTAQVGQVVEVLVEGRSAKDENRLSGRTRANKLVNFAGDLASTPPGSMAKIETTDGFLWGFSGRALEVKSAPKPSRTLIELVAV